MPIEVQKCAKCKITKPYADFHRDHHRWNEISSTCKTCKSEYHREYLRKDRDRKLAKRAARHAERMKNDPEYAERHRATGRKKKREAAKRNPEKLREQAREYYRRRREDPERWAAYVERRRVYYRDVIRKDPERHAAYLEARRITRRLQRLDAGLPVREATAVRRASKAETVNAAPLVPLIKQWEKRYSDSQRNFEGDYAPQGARNALALRAGVSGRLILAVLNGEREKIALDSADKLCHAMDMPLVLVYEDEDTNEGIAA